MTGGDDKKVNMWAIGKPQAILSLSGHQSAVECVTFDQAEEVVVAGAAGGTLKLWDLEEAKVVRTLTGHRSNCTAVDFHPFGEFFASGSLDTNLKIWDIRRKGCIHTYKGHERGVGVCKFSPDGKWVISGGQDGRVKLWDLTAGRLLKEFPSHDGAVTSIEFHPNELLVATGSADRSVRLWDLETFDLVDTAGPEATGVRSMLFTPDGGALLSGTAEFLKVWKWEPGRCCDTVDVSWTKLADLSMHENKLLGGSIHNSFVGVWVVDLNRVEPFHSGAERGPGGGGTREVPERSGAAPVLLTGERGGVSHHGGLHERPVATPGGGAFAPPNGGALGDASVAVAAAAAAGAARARAMEGRDRTTSAVTPPRTGPRTAGGGVYGGVSDAVPFDASRIACEDLRVRGDRAPMEMNAGFAAAHGIGADPLHQKPPAVVVAKPPPPTVDPSGSPRASPSPPHVAITPATGPGGDVDDDVVIEEDTAAAAAAVEVEDASAGARAGSEATGETPAIVQAHPSRPQSARGRFVTPETAGMVDAATGMSGTLTRGAFDLNVLRSAALEAESEFINPADAGDEAGGETLAGAMARVREERALEEAREREAMVVRERAAAMAVTSAAAATATPPTLTAHVPTPTRPSPGGGAIGLDFAAFVPGAASASPAAAPTVDEAKVLAKLGGPDGATVSGILSARLTSLQVARAFWARGDVRGAAEALGKSGDPSVVVDVVSAVMEAPQVAGGEDTLTLELAAALLPLVAPLLQSPHGRYVDLALRFSRKAAGSFMPLLQQAPEALAALERGGIGVDLVGEERATRSGAAREALLNLREPLAALAVGGGELAPRARELMTVLDRL